MSKFTIFVLVIWCMELVMVLNVVFKFVLWSHMEMQDSSDTFDYK